MMTSIIVFPADIGEDLRACLWGIKTFSGQMDYEVFVVGRTAPPQETFGFDIKYVPLESGMVKAINAAISQSHGHNIALVRSDVVVTNQWLEKLQHRLELEDICGAIGPMSYNSSKCQGVRQEEVREYHNVQEMAEVAAEFADKRQGHIGLTAYLESFCILLKRQVLEQQGLLDDSYAKPDMAVLDYTINMVKSGWYSLVLEELWVHNVQPCFETIPPKDKAIFEAKMGFSPNYSMGIRTDLLSLMDFQKANLSVMDIGCSCGGTMMKIVENAPDAQVYGIEMSPGAAAVASHFGHVIQQDMLTVNKPELENKFDYILMGDVLEHIVDTDAALDKVCSWLKKGGRLIVSVPNIGHISIIHGLLRGEWTYQDSGILDRTHMRFFTKQEMLKLFEKHKLTVKTTGFTGPGNITLSDKVLEKQLLDLNGIMVEKENLQAYQWVFVAEK